MHYYAAVLFDHFPAEDEIIDVMERFNEDPIDPIEYDVSLSADDIEYRLSADPENFSLLAQRNYEGEPEVKSSPTQGLYQTYTGNPNGKWDWWSIGGRWDTISEEKEGESNEVERNSLPVSELLQKDITPAAVVVNGEWHGDGGFSESPRNAIGQWDFEAIEKNNREDVMETLQKHKDKIAVGVDCHR